MFEHYNHDTCKEAVIKKVQDETGVSFPPSYIEFLSQSNGGEGTDTDGRYIYLWRCEDILQYNKDYSVQKYLSKDIIAFGMDGDSGFCFDCREQGEPKICQLLLW